MGDVLDRLRSRRVRSATALDPERRARLRQDFIAFHEEFLTELGIRVPREGLVRRSGTRI